MLYFDWTAFSLYYPFVSEVSLLTGISYLNTGGQTSDIRPERFVHMYAQTHSQGHQKLQHFNRKPTVENFFESTEKYAVSINEQDNSCYQAGAILNVDNFNFYSLFSSSIPRELFSGTVTVIRFFGTG